MKLLTANAASSSTRRPVHLSVFAFVLAGALAALGRGLLLDLPAPAGGEGGEHDERSQLSGHRRVSSVGAGR